MPARAPDWIGVLPVAHRGLHDKAAGRLENTLSAIRAAAEAGFAIEIDVQPSRDRRAMVFHDLTLDRLTEATGRIDTFSAEDLGKLAVGGTTDTIPTLAEVLAEIDGRVPLYVEIKHDVPNDGTLEAAVASDLEGYAGPVAIMSFDPYAVIAMRRIAPHVVRGIVSETYSDASEWPHLTAWQRFCMRHILHAAQSRPQFIAYKVHDIPALAPVLLNTVLGLPLLTWTVRTPEDRERARLVGAQMIFEGFMPEATAA
ncbi:MAG: glycerophosphodiester phosphodiesterase [Rhodobiaceae bacterium]|nr:glycerophosphodiester phosphodiesterase [Rhodobiaceae bacterium]